MSYDGLEIDLLNLGDADSILVTNWFNSNPTRILIDGGNSSHSQQVLDFLRIRGASYLDHIVCSHPHDDHAKGLIGIVSSRQIHFGEVWFHRPQTHTNFQTLQSALTNTTATKVQRILKESLITQRDLELAVWNRNKIPQEPFTGKTIGFLTVCSPTISFYEQQLAQFADLGKLNELEEALSSYESRIANEEILQAGTYLPVDGIGLGEAPTEPENETSTILFFSYGVHNCLLTADAGVQALTQAKNSCYLANLDWMQIPHHGSRRNINEELINHFKPTSAFVSAAGNRKHPRRKLVNAFKETGTQVFSTHYQKLGTGHLWYHVGTVPTRADYGPAVALYDAG
jgi:beta-lactamase superfamily II metal-dependent hydrolase